jgi:hypothetical protein
VDGTMAKGSVFQAMTGFSHANESVCTCVLHDAAGFLHRFSVLRSSPKAGGCVGS